MASHIKLTSSSRGTLARIRRGPCFTSMGQPVFWKLRLASEINTHLTLVMGVPGLPAISDARSSLTLSAAFATQLAP